MSQRDVHDIVGGLAMTGVGLFFALYGTQYSMGSAARMGPGYFPIVLGWILAVLGLLIAIPAWWRQGAPIVVQWKSLCWSIASLLAFALLLRTLGVFFSTMVAALVALVPTTLPLLRRFVIATAIAVITTLIFIAGLSMTLAAWPWSP